MAGVGRIKTEIVPNPAGTLDFVELRILGEVPKRSKDGRMYQEFPGQSPGDHRTTLTPYEALQLARELTKQAERIFANTKDEVYAETEEWNQKHWHPPGGTRNLGNR